MTKLKVTSLEIQDVLGAREFSMMPGEITLLSGKNGTGKTTAIESIKSAVGGGSLGKLARIDDAGEEVDPKIVMILDSDEGQKFLVEKNSKGTRVRAQVGDSAGFEDVPKPQRWLSGLFDEHLANPIKFLYASNKDRVLMLLGALPVKLNREKLWERMGMTQDDISPIPTGLHPLQELSMIREAVFRERTGVNRDATQKAATAEQMRRNTPAVLPDDQKELIEKLDREIQAKDNEIATTISEAKSEYTHAVNVISSEFRENKQAELSKHGQWAAEKRAEVEQLIVEDRLQSQEQIDKWKQSSDESKVDLEKERDSKIDKAFLAQSALKSSREKLTELREQARVSVKAKALREQSEKFEIEAEELEEQSQRLTDAIEALDAERRAMADNLPIPGLSVEDKEIKQDGVPFDQLNTAKKMKIAVKVACLRARETKLPLVWIDGAEALDADNFDAMVSNISEEGVQAIIGKVDETALQTQVIK